MKEHDGLEEAFEHIQEAARRAGDNDPVAHALIAIARCLYEVGYMLFDDRESK